MAINLQSTRYRQAPSNKAVNNDYLFPIVNDLEKLQSEIEELSGDFVPLSGTTPGNEITGDLDFSGALVGLYADNDFEIQGGGVDDYSKSWIYFAETELSMGFGEVGGVTKNGVYFNEEESQFLWNNIIIVGVSDNGTVSVRDKDGFLKIIIDENSNLIFLSIPTSSVGLPAGAIWNDGGTLKIV